MLEQISIGVHTKTPFQLRPTEWADLPAIVSLINTCGFDQIGAPETSPSQLEFEWSLPGHNPAHSTRVATAADGRLVGYIEVWDRDPLPVTNFVWARVHPDYQGQGIGWAMMRWAEERLRPTLERVPPDLRVVYHSSAMSTHEPTMRFLAAWGMDPVRHFWHMGIDLTGIPPAPAWPEGIVLRTFAEMKDLHAVFRASNDAFRDHWGHVEQPDDGRFADWEHTVNEEEFDPTLWFLAMAGDEIAGLALCRWQAHADPDRGWVNTLGVRQPWRRRGLGLALLHYAFGEFYRRGKRKVGLGVDAGSLTGATRLYERAGMHVMRQMVAFEKQLRAGRDVRKRTL